MYTRTIILVIIFLLGSDPVRANAQLSPEQLQRLKQVKYALAGAEKRTFQDMMQDLQETGAIDGNLAILEVIAKVYKELIAQYDLQDEDAKARLLEKIRLNMAYYQMGGHDRLIRQESDLTIAIRRKIKEYLPVGLMTDPRFFHNLQQ